jgi:arylformamidase
LTEEDYPMTLHDISLTISEDLPTWPGDPPIELRKISQIDQGDLANVTHLSTPVHMGTHIDAPDHFLNNGKTVETIPLEYFIGPVLVVHIDGSKIISAEDLIAQNISPTTERLIFKTSNSNYWKNNINVFQEDFIALGPDASELLVKMGIKVVGVDYLSVAAYHEPVPTHKILLDANILIIEGLDLSQIDPGEYKLYCLPLKIGSSDGAPARVLLED